MARLEDRLPHNSPGEFYVDGNCIDCDTCRALAPQLFARTRDLGLSYVHRQPECEKEQKQALMALVACPTAAIGTVRKQDLTAGKEAFPLRLHDDVYYCGFTAESSFGASSYFIQRPDGNVLIDSPRPSRTLVRRLRELGGVRWMFLSHRDCVGDHQLFHNELGCERIIHKFDQSNATADVERVIEGEDPVPLGDDLLMIPTPGHTRGSMSLLHRNDFLFTGDHLWWSPKRERLHASRAVSWYSWNEQVKSIRRLLQYKFRHILPSHGRRFDTPTAEDMRRELARLVAHIENQGDTAATCGFGRCGSKKS